MQGEDGAGRMDQITSRQTTSIQARVWGRVGERLKGVLTGSQSLMDPTGAAEQDLHGGLRSPEHWTKLLFQSLGPGALLVSGDGSLAHWKQPHWGGCILFRKQFKFFIKFLPP